LIQINASAGIFAIMPPVSQGSRSMPIDIIVIAVISVAFGVFAATLYWADLQTREITK
jgi:hypothetical protein